MKEVKQGETAEKLSKIKNRTKNKYQRLTSRIDTNSFVSISAVSKSKSRARRKLLENKRSILSLQNEVTNINSSPIKNIQGLNKFFVTFLSQFYSSVIGDNFNSSWKKRFENDL